MSAPQLGPTAKTASGASEGRLAPSQESSRVERPIRAPGEKIVHVPFVPQTLTGRRLDVLAKLPFLRTVLSHRSFQYAAMLPNLFIFMVLLAAGLIGSPVGNRNISIVFVWIFWWFLLIALMVPFFSRVWCLMCPFPLFGDWLQRLRLIVVRSTKTKTGRVNNLYWGLGKSWPKSLTNIWLQNIGFLGLCTFSALLVTRPAFSAWVFIILIALATALAAVYKLRVFCNYVCPVSGFLSLYSMASMTEIRARDQNVCLKCTTKGCRTGSEDGWGCPWFIYMGKLERNNYCGMCMECLKSCPNENITVNLRPFASDIGIKGYDEAYKGFIMLTLAMAYSVILLGPYGTIKDWANVTEVGDLTGFAIYALILWSTALVIVPALFGGCVWLARKAAGRAKDEEQPADFKAVFLGYSYTMVPLGLMAWIAFSFPLLFVNGSYIVSVASDPFGWGWDLFGTAHVPWTPLIPEYLVYIQMPLLAIGLVYALRRALQIGHGLFGDNRRARRALWPIGGFCTVATCGFLMFFVG